MARHEDFGNIIAKEFKAGTKGLKEKSIVLVITNAGGDKRKVKVVSAGPDSFSGYIGNTASEGFSANLTVFNPDQVVSFERL